VSRTRFWGFSFGKRKADWFTVPRREGPAVPIFDSKDKALAFATLYYEGDARRRREMASAIKRLKPHSLSRDTLVIANPAITLGDKVLAQNVKWQDILSAPEERKLATINAISGEAVTPEEPKEGEWIVPGAIGAHNELTPMLIPDTNGEVALPVFTTQAKARRGLEAMASVDSRTGTLTTSEGIAIATTVAAFDKVVALAKAMSEKGVDVDYIGIDMEQGTSEKIAILRVRNQGTND
jgi:hypothetical protein